MTGPAPTATATAATATATHHHPHTRRHRGEAHLDLARRVKDHVLMLRSALLEETKQLVELGGEEVQRRHNRPVGAQRVLLHHLLVLDRIADVHIRLVRH